MTSRTIRASRVAESRRKRGRVVDGILLLDKPVGVTSNRVLQQVKRRFGARKAGHTGSLDPLASGMLPICFGQATKLSGFLLDAAKAYTVQAHWGRRTDTADADGDALEESSVTEVARELLEQVLEGFTGEIEQVPPMYSALKHGGQRLYQLARAGQTVERPPRRVRIYGLSILRFDACRPVLQVHCSKGTYVRTLVEDIAAACGTLGYVAGLRRLWVEPFVGSPMASIAQLEAAEDEAALDSLLMPVDAAIADWASLELGADQAYYLSHGHPVTAAVRHGLTPGRVRLYGPQARFLGIGEVLGDGRVAPRRLFVQGLENKA
jgi:tRNA pseudouridine55 synthase